MKYRHRDLSKFCDDICDPSQLIERRRIIRKAQLEKANDKNAQDPMVYFGRLSFGRSRDIAQRDFEVSRKRVAAIDYTRQLFVPSQGPTIFVKGVRDYADDHINEKWWQFAEATAAAAVRAILEDTVEDGDESRARDLIQTEPQYLLQSLLTRLWEIENLCYTKREPQTMEYSSRRLSSFPKSARKSMELFSNCKFGRVSST